MFDFWDRCPYSARMSKGTESPRYARARHDGLKPWVVAVTQWGQTKERIIYASSASEAAYEGKGRQLYTYAKARRATPDEVERLS